MSNSYVPLRPVKVVDPVNIIDKVRDYAVVESGNRISWKAYTSTAISSSAINWSCPPPSSNIITDRQIMVTIPVRLTMVAAAVTNNGAYTPNVTILNSGKFAPRAYPISSALETLSVTINGDTITQKVSDTIHALSRYNTGTDVKTGIFSTFPNYLDCSQNYSDLFGTNRNPLGNYSNGCNGDQLERGAFPFTIVANPVIAAATGAGTSTTVIVDMLVTEPLFMSPMYFGDQADDNQGFFNVNSLDVSLNFIANAAYRMFSLSDSYIAESGADHVSVSVTSASVQFNNFTGTAFSYDSQPQLLFKYITPNVLMPLNQNIPYTYPYFEIQNYNLDIGTLAYSAGAQYFNSNAIQLNQIPRAVIIYARPTNQELQSDMTLTDTYLAIKNVSIQFCNQNTVMSTATQQQLFGLNNKNGSNQSWSEWSGLGVFNSAVNGTSGFQKFSGGAGPLKLMFGQDIQLDGDQAPGLGNGQYMFSLQVQLQNTNSGTQWDEVNMSLVCVFINEGTMTILPGSAQHQLGVLSKMNILDAQSQPGINYRKIQNVSGGDFWSGLSDFASKVNNFLKDSKVISNVASIIPHPIAQGIATGAKNLGYGYEPTKKSRSIRYR